MKIAVIPARKNSKRIKNKNIKNFLGKPILERTIEKLKKSKFFDLILVSTDDIKIKKLALSCGAEVPYLRSKKLSNDHATIGEVMQDAAKFIKKKWNVEYLCCVFATSPFLQKNKLLEGYKILKKKKKSFVFSASKIDNTVLRSFYAHSNNGLKMILPKSYLSRSQDLKNLYCDSGQFYWGNINSWIKKEKIFYKNSSIVEIPSYLNHDINTADDWKYAENFAKKNKKYL